jgi:hypothetical protein
MWRPRARLRTRLRPNMRISHVSQIAPGCVSKGVIGSPDGKRLLLSSIDGVVSVAVAPGSPPIVYTSGQLSYPGGGLDLEWSWSEVTWQPVTGPTR